MKKNFLKLSLTIITIALLSIAFCGIVSAEIYTGDCGLDGDNLTYKLDTSTGILEITGVGAMQGYSPWAGYKSCIKIVEMSDNITTIGYSAFSGCQNLTKITLPDSLISIGNYSFAWCEKLTSINMPSAVLNVGNRAFAHCKNLETITFSKNVKTIGDYVLEGCQSLKFLKLPSLEDKILGEYFGKANYDNNRTFVPESLTTVQIDGGTRISSSAFFGCERIEKIILPETITEIGSSTFYYCTALKNINIPNNIKSIGYEAFNSCSSLEEILLPPKLIKINAYAFDGTAIYLDENNWNNGVLYIGTHLIDTQKNIEGKYIIDKGTTTIAQGAFSNCLNLTELEIPKSVSFIGAGAFSGCKNLQTINLPQDICEIEYSTFSNCQKLKQIDLPSNIRTIGGFAFSDCSGLESITIPYGVENIGDKAFMFCDNITHITLPNTILKLEEKIFWKCYKLKTIFFDGTIDEWYSIEKDPNWDFETSDYEVIFLKDNLKLYSSSTEPVFINDGEIVLKELGCEIDKLLSNTTYTNNTILGPQISISDSDFNIFSFPCEITMAFPEDFPISVEANTKDKTIKVLYGIKNDENKNEFDNDEINDLYDQIKSAYHNDEYDKSLFGKINNHHQNCLNSFKSKLITNVEMTVAGFAEFNYESGVMVLTDGGLIFKAEASVDVESRIPTFLLAYGTMGLGLEAEGKLVAQYKEENIHFYTNLEILAAINFGIGLGFKQTFLRTYIEGGLKGAIEAKVTLADDDYYEANPKESPISCELTGSLYLEGALTIFYQWEVEKKFIKVPLHIKDDTKKMLYAAIPHSSETTTFSKQLPRDYLYKPFFLAIDDDNKIFSDTSIYNYNAPVITNLSNNSIMMLWLDDLGTKAGINRTSLMYSVYDGKEWSERKEIFETGTYNGDPVIFNDGTYVHIVWSKAKKALTDDNTLEDLTQEIEVIYTRYDGYGFSEPVQITNNSIMESSYAVTACDDKIAVAWIENSENNAQMDSGINTLYIIECINGVWSDKTEIVSDSNPIGEINLFYANNTLNYTYAILDEMFRSNLYFNNDFLTVGSYSIVENEILYYLNDNILMSFDTRTKVFSETGLTNIDNFSIHNGNAYTLVLDGYRTELYESRYIAGKYEDWKQVTEFDRYIRNYSVAQSNTGDPIYALNLISVNEESDHIYGSAELTVCKASEIYAVSVDNVYYDYKMVEPSQVLPINLEITNRGNTDISSILVEAYDELGQLVSSQSIACQINSGKRETISYNYFLQDDLSFHKVFLKVVLSQEERDVSDNVAEIYVGYADLKIEVSEVTRGKNGAETKVTISNLGYEDANEITLTVYDSDAPDIIIDTIVCDNIGVGETLSLIYSIPEKYLTLENKMTLHGLTFKVEAKNNESNLANNSRKVVFGEMTEYTIMLIDDGKIVDIISTKDFSNYIIAKENYIFDGWYLTSMYYEETKVTTLPSNLSSNILLYAKWRVENAGDINNDGVINIKDAVLLAQYLAKWDVTLDMKAADCNADGKIDIKDAVLLAQYLAKWKVTLG